MDHPRLACSILGPERHRLPIFFILISHGSLVTLVCKPRFISIVYSIIFGLCSGDRPILHPLHILIKASNKCNFVRWRLDIDGERYVERAPFWTSDKIILLNEEIQGGFHKVTLDLGELFLDRGERKICGNMPGLDFRHPFLAGCFIVSS